MSSPKAILRDINDMQLDPRISYTKTNVSGHLIVPGKYRAQAKSNVVEPTPDEVPSLVETMDVEEPTVVAESTTVDVQAIEVERENVKPAEQAAEPVAGEKKAPPKRQKKQ